MAEFYNETSSQSAVMLSSAGTGGNCLGEIFQRRNVKDEYYCH